MPKKLIGKLIIYLDENDEDMVSTHDIFEGTNKIGKNDTWYNIFYNIFEISKLIF